MSDGKMDAVILAADRVVADLYGHGAVKDSRIEDLRSALIAMREATLKSLEPEGLPPLWHQSGVNLRGEPFIQLILGESIIAQQSVEQARESAMAMLEAAEAAEQDAFLLFWVTTHLEQDPKVAACILQEFRNFRRERTGKRSGQEVIPTQESKP